MIHQSSPKTTTNVDQKSKPERSIYSSASDDDEDSDEEDSDPKQAEPEPEKPLSKNALKKLKLKEAQQKNSEGNSNMLKTNLSPVSMNNQKKIIQQSPPKTSTNVDQKSKPERSIYSSASDDDDDDEDSDEEDSKPIKPESEQTLSKKQNQKQTQQKRNEGSLNVSSKVEQESNPERSIYSSASDDDEDSDEEDSDTENDNQTPIKQPRIDNENDEQPALLKAKQQSHSMNTNPQKRKAGDIAGPPKRQNSGKSNGFPNEKEDDSSEEEGAIDGKDFISFEADEGEESNADEQSEDENDVSPKKKFKPSFVEDRTMRQDREESDYKVFVNNLPYDTTENKLRDVLSNGQITSVVIPPSKDHPGECRGFAFVELADQESLNRVLELDRKAELGGQSLGIRVYNKAGRGGGGVGRGWSPGGRGGRGNFRGGRGDFKGGRGGGFRGGRGSFGRGGGGGFGRGRGSPGGRGRGSPGGRGRGFGRGGFNKFD